MRALAAFGLLGGWLTMLMWPELEVCYHPLVTKDQIKAVLERVLTWPSERQEDVAEIVKTMEAQDDSGHRLTDDQADEVRRRRAETSPKTLTLAQFNDRLRHYGR